MTGTISKLYFLLFIGIALASARETIFHVHKARLGEKSTNYYESLTDVAASINASATPAVIIIQEPQLLLTSIVQFQSGISAITIEGNGANISCQAGTE